VIFFNGSAFLQAIFLSMALKYIYTVLWSTNKLYIQIPQRAH